MLETDGSGYIHLLSDLPTDPAAVGGKGANLARLTAAGLPVPPGFIVTTAAYRERDLPTWNAVATAIVKAYAALGGGPVAVRSSATAEDREDASFAGQQDTFLNVAGDGAVLEAVRACWASLHAERAVAYRRSRQISEEAAAMAVVVQRMVPAEAAGVLFTRDPVDPEGSRMLAEAVRGLGETLVSGQATPDRWTLDRASGQVLSHAPAVPASDSSPCPPCLSGEDLQRLASLGQQVERLYGAPQDIEWALAGGELFLLQSRPITALASEREALRREEIAALRRRAEPAGTVWARYSLAEVLPEPLPFSWALWRKFMSGRGGYGRMYRELGYDPDPALDEEGLLDLIAGRPYFNLSRDARLYFRNYPFEYPFARLKEHPERAIYPALEVNLARAPKGFLLKLPGITRRMVAAEKVQERAAEEVPGQLEREAFPGIATFAAAWRTRDLSGLCERELVTAFADCRARVMDDFAAQSLKPSVLAGLALLKLTAELKSALGEDARSAAEGLLSGVRPPEEYDLARGLERLGAGELSPDRFLDGFGHRGPDEMELAAPRWREAPPVVSSVPGGGSCPDTGCGRANKTHRWVPPPANGEAYLRRPGNSQGCEGPGGGIPDLESLPAAGKVNRRKVSRYLGRARRFTALRETAKHHLLLGYEVLRLLLLEIDRRFALAGGVFYLEPEELPQLLDGADLRGRIAARRKQRSLALSLEAPRVLFSDDLEALGRPLVPAREAAGLRGTGVSPGSAEGVALVVRHPQQVDSAAQDFILVCPSTDPGWTPLFLRARGVVLETGGVLSHGAIVARELGLPAVANIADACSRFRSGQRLHVDGATGRVTVLS